MIGRGQLDGSRIWKS